MTEEFVGDVLSVLRNDGFLDPLKVLHEVALGLAYLHKENVVHGDIRAVSGFSSRHITG